MMNSMGNHGSVDSPRKPTDNTIGHVWLLDRVVPAKRQGRPSLLPTTRAISLVRCIRRAKGCNPALTTPGDFACRRDGAHDGRP